MNKRILALDLATSTGYAYSNEKGHVELGSINIRQHESAPLGQKWLDFETRLIQLIRENEIEEIAFEQIDHFAPMKTKKGGATVPTTYLLLYGGLRSIVEKTSLKMRIPLCGYHLKDIKKSWTGNGNATKELMVQKALSMGFHPQNDDEADALATLSLHMKRSKTQ